MQISTKQQFSNIEWSLSGSANELVSGFDSANDAACEPWVMGRPSLIVSENYAVWRFNSRKGKRVGVKENLLNVGTERKKYNGNISKATKSKIRKMLSGWLQSLQLFKDTQVSKNLYAKRLPTFVTLTLPSQVSISDKDAKRLLLSRFLDIVKAKYNVKEYFWRAESQSNGIIHFHVIFDAYIWKKYIAMEWNKLILNNTNAIEYQTEKQILSNPSTHVIGIKDVKNFVEYVVKYATKDEEHRLIEGRLWGCSDNLRLVKQFELDCTPRVESFLQILVKRLNIKVKQESGYTLYFKKNLLRELRKFKQVDYAYKEYLKDCILTIYDEQYRALKEVNSYKNQSQNFGQPFIIPVPSLEQLRFLFN